MGRTHDDIRADVEKLEKHNRTGIPLLKLYGEPEQLVIARLIKDIYSLMELGAANELLQKRLDRAKNVMCVDCYQDWLDAGWREGDQDE